jgi:hypothetical protein
MFMLAAALRLWIRSYTMVEPNGTDLVDPAVSFSVYMS